MAETAEQILQKISFIEQDIELHKNILAAIPAERPDEIEEVLKTIVHLKERAESLKQSISEIDPEVYARIQQLEQATEEFKKLADRDDFQVIATLNQHHECFVTLKEGGRLDCLVKGRDSSGTWTVLTLDGETKQFCGDDVLDA